MFSELRDEGLVTDLQHFGGPAAIATGFGQRKFQLTAFNFVYDASGNFGEGPRQVDTAPGADVFFNCPVNRRADPKRQAKVPRMDSITFGEDHGALDAVLQLAHVAGPGVGAQLELGRWRQRQRLFLQLRAPGSRS